MSLENIWEVVVTMVYHGNFTRDGVLNMNMQELLFSLEKVREIKKEEARAMNP